MVSRSAGRAAAGLRGSSGCGASGDDFASRLRSGLLCSPKLGASGLTACLARSRGTRGGVDAYEWPKPHLLAAHPCGPSARRRCDGRLVSWRGGVAPAALAAGEMALCNDRTERSDSFTNVKSVTNLGAKVRWFPSFLSPFPFLSFSCSAVVHG